MIGTSEDGHRRDNPFLERVRRALAHDLRTPLGTIANYAAILEFQAEGKPADVRVFAARIRQSAVRTAAMLQHLTEAIVLSERKPSAAGLDPAGLVRALLAEMAVHVRFPARAAEPRERVPFDPDLIAFTWRAFLGVNAQAQGNDQLDLDVEVERLGPAIALDMWIGPRPSEPPTRTTSARFADGAGDAGPLESCFALGLAEELIHARGGELGLWGKPGKGANLRVIFPG